MMNSICIKLLLIACLLIYLTGCWSSNELPDFGFLMGVSVDQAGEGKIELNAHVYAPTVSSVGQSSGGGKPLYTNVKMIDRSIFNASRNLTRYLGRKAQWSHMRVILIGEQFAKENDIGEFLDSFYRDHEVRLTTFVIITQGKAADYWKEKPFIEQTMGQQLRRIIENSGKFSGTTNHAQLIDIASQLNSKVKIVMVPYIKPVNEKQKTPYSSGVSIIKRGKMVARLTSGDTKNILMLTNGFEKGSIDFPCMSNGTKAKGKEEALELASVTTKISPIITKNPPTIHMETKIEGMASELRCTSITNEKEVEKLENHIAKGVKSEIEALIEHVQKKKLDVLGIGNRLYRQDPALWRKWEKDWDNRFANIRFIVDVEVSVKGTGMLSGKKIMGE